MNKEEMKNKYSAFIAEISEIMGLGKPIDILKLCKTTDLFFRPFEKRIAELEKENAELIQENEEMKKGLGCETCQIHLEYMRLNAKVNDLEKENERLTVSYETLKLHDEEEIGMLISENAELKHNKKTVVHLADCLEEKMKERIEELETRCTELFLQNNEFAERFEKSKEIIKKLLSCCRNYPRENAEKMEQAEQFLKENGGEKCQSQKQH